MTTQSENEHDPDIVDYAFYQNPEDVLNLNDSDDCQGMVVPVYSPGVTAEKGARGLSPFEEGFRDALSVHAAAALYMIEGMGFSRIQADEIVGQKLSTMSVATARKQGRESCTRVLPVSDPENFAEISKKRLVAFANKPRHEKIQEIEEDLNLLKFLDDAFSRAKELTSGLYNAQRARSEETESKQRVAALTYRPKGFKIPLPELVKIAFHARQNPCWLWQSYWYYRHVLEAAVGLGHLYIGRPGELTLMQIYTIFRMSEGIVGDDETEHNFCKKFFTSGVESFVGLEAFHNHAKTVLKPLNLITQRPASVQELEARCIEAEYGSIVGMVL